MKGKAKAAKPSAKGSGAANSAANGTPESVAAPKKNGSEKGRFVKGDPRAGRPPGVPNKATLEAKEACSGLVDDPAYRKRLRRRLLAGKLAPAVETMLWHYAKGKPKETVGLEGPNGGPVEVVARIEALIVDPEGGE